MVQAINDADFDKEVLQAAGLVLVDFWADWCGPCKMMAPVYEKMAQKYSQVKFCKMDTSKNMVKASVMGVSGIPCIIIFKGGQEVGRIVGYRPEDVFEAELKKYIV